MSWLQVPVSAGSLNNGDSFILDCGHKIYVFNGTNVGLIEKTKVGFRPRGGYSGTLVTGRCEALF